jgi:hypothetical protein
MKTSRVAHFVGWLSSTNKASNQNKSNEYPIKKKQRESFAPKK